MINSGLGNSKSLRQEETERDGLREMGWRRNKEIDTSYLVLVFTFIINKYKYKAVRAWTNDESIS